MNLKIWEDVTEKREGRPTHVPLHHREILGHWDVWRFFIVLSWSWYPTSSCNSLIHGRWRLNCSLANPSWHPKASFTARVRHRAASRHMSFSIVRDFHCFPGRGSDIVVEHTFSLIRVPVTWLVELSRSMLLSAMMLTPKMGSGIKGHLLLYFSSYRD